MNSGPHRQIKMWFIIFSLAIFLDFAMGPISAALGLGLITNRLISAFVYSGFAFTFSISGVKNWGWKLFFGGIGESIPILGDFLPFWTGTLWRIYRAQPKPVEEGEAGEQEERGGEEEGQQPQEA